MRELLYIVSTICQPLFHVSILSGSKHLLYTYYLSGAILDAGNIVVMKLEGENTDGKQIITTKNILWMRSQRGNMN